MKKFALFLSVLGVMGMLSSCSDDDSPAVPGSSLETKTYTAADGLQLTLDGEAVVGQTVEFIPFEDGNASIAIKGEPLDLSALIGDATGAPAGIKLPTSSLIPGSPELTLPLVLEGTADKATFTGNGDTEYCTFKYVGAVDKDAFTLNITDLKLKNVSMAGTYATSESTAAIYDVYRVNWVSDKKVNVGIFGEMPVNTVVSLAFAFTQVSVDGETMNLMDALTTVLKDVTFGEDGSIIARYADTDDNLAVKTSPKGYARYVVKDSNTLLVFIDPATIIANVAAAASKGSRAIDIESLMQGLMTNVVPLLKNGVPVHFGPRLITDGTTDNNMIPDPEGKGTGFYLGTETVLPLLKMAAPILSDPEIIQQIVAEASKDPNMGMMAMMLPGILESLPAVIDGTTVVELGINLYK